MDYATITEASKQTGVPAEMIHQAMLAGRARSEQRDGETVVVLSDVSEMGRRISGRAAGCG